MIMFNLLINSLFNKYFNGLGYVNLQKKIHLYSFDNITLIPNSVTLSLEGLMEYFSGDF